MSRARRNHQPINKTGPQLLFSLQKFIRNFFLNWYWFLNFPHQKYFQTTSPGSWAPQLSWLIWRHTIKLLSILAVLTNDHVGGDFNQQLCRTQTSRRPASDLGSRSLVGVWGSHDQMSPTDLQMMEMIALEINSIRKYDYDDATVSNMWKWQKPFDSDPNVHLFAPISRQLFKLISDGWGERQCSWGTGKE